MSAIRTGALILLSTLALSGQEITASVNCPKNLKIPTYSAIMRAVRLQGEARVRILIGERGTTSDVNVEYGGPNSTPTANLIRLQIGMPEFHEECAGQVFELRLIYVLEGPSQEASDSKVEIVGPNTFKITSNPLVIPTQP